MERFNNLFNGYGFNTNEYIRKNKEERNKNLKEQDDYLKENAKKEEEERKWQSKIDR